MQCNRFFEEEETDAVLLIDAENAFNSMNRKAALVNIHIGCPFIALFVINTYRNSAKLVLANGDVILSNEGTTQGDPLAMPWYSINSSIVISHLRFSDPTIRQAWLADDASAAGNIGHLKLWFDDLKVIGKKFGYYVNSSKTWLIVKNIDSKVYAENIFNNEINVTCNGYRHLGAAIGTQDFKDEYCGNLVDVWRTTLLKLSSISVSYPQAAYVGFRRGFLSKMTFFFRTIPDFQRYLDVLQTVMECSLIPNLFGSSCRFQDDFNNLLSLPTSRGGLGLPILKDDANFQFQSSMKISAVHVDSLKHQDQILRSTDSTNKTYDELVAVVRRDKKEMLDRKSTLVMQNLAPDFLPLHKQNNDQGASHWLNAIPLREQGFNLTKSEFKDALRLRYDVPLSGLQSFCVCGERFDVLHALSCKKGGFINLRHDNIKNTFTIMLNKVCTNVAAEPHLTPLTGEHLNYLTSNRQADARLDIKARGFWRRGQDAYFDIRVTHVNARSNSEFDTQTVFLRHEQEKKRAYNQRVVEVENGTFTPLVIGTNGGTGKECSAFIKHLCTLLAEKQNEYYSSVVNWLRTKLSFEVLKSSLLCVRGTRKPWSNGYVAVDDFALLSHEAGL